MIERPVLMNGESVRAILDGRKTMTRRPLKTKPPHDKHYNFASAGYGPGDLRDNIYYYFVDMGPTQRGLGNISYQNPHGVPGDRLWVRETWRVARINGTLGDGAEFATIQFKSGFGVLGYRRDWHEHYANLLAQETKWQKSEAGNLWGRWRPSIHMPRWASRIDLLVKDVRVERVQDISKVDAIAEGIDMDSEHASLCINIEECSAHENNLPDGSAAKAVFQKLWDSIYAKRGFGRDTNPFVWVTEFEHVRAT